jgi:hypothetical protein
MKIRALGAELFHADGETDGRADRHDEANSLFRNFRPRVKIETFNINYNLPLTEVNIIH